ncbi:hypothetical protein VP01_2143g1 [Puccinia sorghi]|uniref:Uncharacterized protein n=1 Tax=Puccinia sorghi TaxID=27349 RepID=A0A0L6V9R2_9BASI|nr:hypothetical protein VP01_2143g1 [Puccinia sorghi]
MEAWLEHAACQLHAGGTDPAFRNNPHSFTIPENSLDDAHVFFQAIKAIFRWIGLSTQFKTLPSQPTRPFKLEFNFPHQGKIHPKPYSKKVHMKTQKSPSKFCDFGSSAITIHTPLKKCSDLSHPRLLEKWLNQKVIYVLNGRILWSLYSPSVMVRG